MLFFISPVSSLVQKLSNEKDLLVFLGLKGVTNSVNEFQLYYDKFFGFLIHHLEAAIAKIEADETVEEKPAVQQPAIPEIPGYTPEEVEAYESIFGEYPPSPAPAVEDVIQPATPTAPVELEPTQEIIDDSETENLKDRLLQAKNKKELDAIKAENPEDVTKLWDTLSIPEKNHIKCITQSVDGRKRPVTPGYRFIYTAPNGSEQYVRYIGYYLHGEAITDEDKRAILLDGIGIICSKKDLKPSKKQFTLKDSERELLEDIMSNPAKTKPVDTTEEVELEAPTAKQMAENTFTGLVPPKKPQDGLTSGKTQSSQPSKQNAGQKVLDLKTSESQPETTTEAKPTQSLKILQEKIAIANSKLSFGYDSFGGRTFLEVYHEDERIGTFEDDGNSVWMKGCSKMYNHGFTDELFEILLDEETLKSPKA